MIPLRPGKESVTLLVLGGGRFPKMIWVYMSDGDSWMLCQVHKFIDSYGIHMNIWQNFYSYKQIDITFLMFKLRTGGSHYQQDVGTSVVEFFVGT